MGRRQRADAVPLQGARPRAAARGDAAGLGGFRGLGLGLGQRRAHRPALLAGGGGLGLHQEEARPAAQLGERVGAAAAGGHGRGPAAVGARAAGPVRWRRQQLSELADGAAPPAARRGRDDWRAPGGLPLLVVQRGRPPAGGAVHLHRGGPRAGGDRHLPRARQHRRRHLPHRVHQQGLQLCQPPGSKVG